MRNPVKVVIDAWSGISHKAPMSGEFRDTVTSRVNGWAPAGWVGEDNVRRLTAYLVLSAYVQNVSREFIQGDEQDRKERREYGDADLIVDTILSAVLGEDQTVTVEDADEWDLDRWNDLISELDALQGDGEETDVPIDPLDEQSRPGPDATETERRTAEIQAELAALEDAERAWERQQFLQDWARDVHLTLRMVDLESDAVALGDGVMLLGWDADKGRVVPAVMNPGFYFPVIPDSLDAYEYPMRVHFAWEFVGDDDKARVRRITYEVRDIEQIVDEAAFAAARTAEERDAAFSDPPGTTRVTVDDNGIPVVKLARTYPWATEPSTLACYKTDATWLLDDIDDPRGPQEFTLRGKNGAEVIDVEDEDLGIDFLPVVHIPNTPPGGEHFGKSSLARVLQLLDDLQNADTDAQAASATTGSPIIATFGMRQEAQGNPLLGTLGAFGVGGRKIAPGEIWEGQQGGNAVVLSTAEGLAATREYVKELRDRLAVNAQIPGSLLGTVAPSEVPSGITLQLSFGPMSNLIRKMRLVRSVKYSLLLKMVQRLYQANDELPAGETMRGDILLGSFLPSDMTGTLSLVKDALAAHAISLETAVSMLLEVGFPIDDVAAEVLRICEQNFEAANVLASATGDQAAVREYLGLPPKDTTPTAPLVTENPDGSPVIAPGTNPQGTPVAGGTGTGVPSPTDSGTSGGAGSAQ